MNWILLADVASAACFLAGSFLALAAGVGALRFPDLPARLHAGTKPQVLGLILVLAGLALRVRTGWVTWTLLLVVLFQALTAPVAAHLLARAGFRTWQIRPDILVVNELGDDVRTSLTEASAADDAHPPREGREPQVPGPGAGTRTAPRGREHREPTGEPGSRDRDRTGDGANREPDDRGSALDRG